MCNVRLCLCPWGVKEGEEADLLQEPWPKCVDNSAECFVKLGKASSEHRAGAGRNWQEGIWGASGAYRKAVSFL